jgi:YVTN family beta-propeller protein
VLVAALAGTVVLGQGGPPPKRPAFRRFESLSVASSSVERRQAQGGPERSRRTGVATPGIKIPIERLKPDAVFEVGGNPDWLAIDQAAWVSNKPKDTVSRFDPKTNTVAATIALGAGKRPCSGLTVGFGSVWVPNCGDQTISRVDTTSNAITATFKTSIGNTEGSIATGAGSVWMVVDTKGTLARIDPATNKIVAEIYVASGSYGLTFGEGAVWVTSSDHDSVARVDPQTNLVVETIPVGKKPRFIAAGGGAVWALNQGDGSVSRIDPKTNKVAATIEVGVPGGGGDIAVGEGSVWVTSFEFPISRIDPATNKVVQQFFGKGGDAIRVGLGSVWLSNLEAGNVWRIDPKRVEATLPN